MPRVKPGRPSQPKLTHRHILSAALRLYALRGVEKTSLRDLAAALHVDPMALYHYFPNREKLLAAALEQAFEALPQKMPEGCTARAAATRLLLAYLDTAKKHRSLTVHLLSRQDAWPTNLVRFNEALLQALGQHCQNTPLALRLRDILIDYTHGYLLAAGNFSVGGGKQAQAEFTNSVELILNAGQT